MSKYTGQNSLTFLLQQIKAKFQAKELKTGSMTQYKELTDNNLTNALKESYDAASVHATSTHVHNLTDLGVTSNATELNQLDGITLGSAAQGTVSTGGVSNNSTNLVTEAQVKTYVDNNTNLIDDTAGDGDVDSTWSADKIHDELATKVNSISIGANSGICPLDSNGKVDSSHLPSFVDDVVEGYISDGVFYEESTYITAITGETSKIYIDLSTGISYRYSGSVYVAITNGAMVELTNSEIQAIIDAL